MTQVIGISNFGLRDETVWQDGILEDTSFTLSHVLIPDGYLGTILTGKNAIIQRAHTGLSWPPEAQLNSATKNLRRAPISVLWRALVEAGESSATWKNTEGMDYSVGKLLTHDIHSAYLQAKDRIFQKEQEQDMFSIVQPQPVIAIPNFLDEAGQDALLQECKSLNMPEPYLLWRPVAAALSWLKNVESELLEGNITHKNEHIHVFYFGADAMEFTTLRLRRYEHNGKIYLLPLRDTPTIAPQLTGLDWAANIVESLCNSKDLGAFWQGLTAFPEVWQGIAHESFSHEVLPRPWSTDKGWKFWHPQDMSKKMQHIPARSGEFLYSVIGKAFSLKKYKSNETFIQQLTNNISQFLAKDVRLSKEHLRGIILCGPLITRKTMQSWLQEILQPVAQHTNIQSYSTKAGLDKIYLSEGQSSIAEGAKIYGERRLKNIPTYLDTMPQISLYTVTRGAGKWYPLLNAQEVLGGEEFKDVIERKFSLPKRNNHINIVLCKGKSPETDVNALPETPKEFTECEARFVREWVRQQGHYNNVCIALRSPGRVRIKQYAETIANHYFNPASPTVRDANIGTTPFRSNTVNFSAISEHDIGLDVHVNMKPAAGRARVIFTPRDTNFMGGRSIRMNYDTMKPIHAPPKPQRGWPEILEIVAHPDDSALLRSRNIDLINHFCSISPNEDNYQNTIEEVKKKCLLAPYQKTWENITLLRLYPFTEDGLCCTQQGENKLAQISKKFSQDFAYLSFNNDIDGIEKLLSRATWLYTRTPVNIKAYIRKNLKSTTLKPSLMNTLIESAGKCFTAEEDLRLFFDAIKEKTFSQYYTFNIQAMRSVSRALRYRHAAPDALTTESAAVFAQGAIDIMMTEARQGTYKQKFFQAVVLLLYLLRFRIVSDYFSPNNKVGMAPYHKAIELIKKAKNYFQNSKNQNQANKVAASLKEFEDFIAYKASSAYPSATSEMT